jgi:phage tail sheath protein FI
MPRHFRTQDALRYVGRLRAVREPPGLAEPEAFGYTERPVLSYGAMYFPWLQADVRTGAKARDLSIAALLRGKPRVVSPDGVALGVLAARATNRGAWIAAANEPMKDVVGLIPAVAASDWQALQDAQVNLLRDDPRGFLALSADTLALDSDVRPINVRRLLILLRRLALRRGMSYVFEPNGAELRRAVERGFNALLGELFRRGAFAGRTEQESFRVVADDTINTPRDAEAGRFIVELRVAPAIPMRFISVLLAQSGGRLTVTEEL